MTDELSRDLSGHFRSSTPSPVHILMNGEGGSLQQQQLTLKQQQQLHDQDLQILLNESIRSATRTCIWVFRCQITKNLAKAFHIWFRNTTGHVHPNQNSSPIMSYKDYTNTNKTDRHDKKSSPKNGPAATRKLPITVQEKLEENKSYCSDLSDSVHDQAVQDLLNSSIVSAADSLHDEKRSYLCKLMVYPFFVFGLINVILF